jgi:hypothetical protein
MRLLGGRSAVDRFEMKNRKPYGNRILPKQEKP